MKKLIVPAAFLVMIISSCRYIGGEKIRGNGVIKTENRTTGTFNSIQVSGNADVYVKQDSVYAVKVETDENLLDYLVTEVEGNTLVIRPRDRANLKSSHSIKVSVSGPSFTAFKASGACSIYSDNKITGTESVFIDLSGASDIKMDLMAPRVEAELSGAGSIMLTGQTKDFEVKGSGSTDIQCFDLLSEYTRVKLSGAGNAEVYASMTLDVHVSGAADIKYKGNASVSQKISGAGSVKKVN